MTESSSLSRRAPPSQTHLLPRNERTCQIWAAGRHGHCSPARACFSSCWLWTWPRWPSAFRYEIALFAQSPAVIVPSPGSSPAGPDRGQHLTTCQIIARDLAASQLLTFTLATGYFLSQTVFQLVFSHISHGLGRKYVYISGVTIWIVGASIAAGSNKMPQLVAARFVQGVGAAGMYTMSAIVVVEILPLRKRAAYTAISQAFGALGNICGPLFAALLFKKFNWVRRFCPRRQE